MIYPFCEFAIEGKALSCEPYGEGHINLSFRLETDTGSSYMLQNINTHVFRNPEALMRNIGLVTRHLARKQPGSKHALRLVSTLDGQDCYISPEGEYWRMFDFISGGICLQQVECADDFYQSAVAFGEFQNMLSDFPAETLVETIPHFHDTPRRVQALRNAVEADIKGRAASVKAEIDFALAREKTASRLVDLQALGVLPLRVTHNDTKLNNVILDAKTHKPLCVIDLDTVMPGLSVTDFGDAIRFGASTAAEDEPDLEKVHFDIHLYNTYLDGYLMACGKSLTAEEMEALPLGAALMTLECGVRFLTDYIEGDQYFHINRPEHNLDRCHTQFKLLAEMEQAWRNMNDAIEKARKKLNC